MLQEFKAFAIKGNVIDLAVGVIIGGAFGKIVDSLVADLIMPMVSALIGRLDFSNLFIALGAVPAGTGTTLDALRKAGVPVLAYGSFIGEIINFLILAFVVFLIVRFANKVVTPAPAAPAAEPADVILLREIRDELKKRG